MRNMFKRRMALIASTLINLYILFTTSGVSPLSLLNAVTKEIRSLIQHGKCVQDGTPTPDNPVDIGCNNGTLKMRHRSGLPSGYKLLEYVGGSGSQYVITDLYLASTDVVECEFRNSSTTGYGAVYGVFKIGESSALYGNQTYYGYDESNNRVDTDIRVNTEWHSSRHDFVNGILTIDDTTVTFTPFEFVNSTKNAILSRFYNGSYGYNWKGFVRKFKVTRNGEVICDLLPAKNSSDVAGLYDLISGAFYTATGGTLLEGNVVDDYELIIDGTPEVLTVSANGTTQTASVENLFAVGDFKDEQEIISGTVAHKVGIKVLDGTESWIEAETSSVMRYCTSIADAVGGVDRSPVACTHFTYASSLQPIGGAFLSSKYLYLIPDQSIDTVEAFAAVLAAQYAAGTPVIVLYPLENETSELVTSQHLHTASGTNTVSVEAEVDGIELAVEYYGKST